MSILNTSLFRKVGTDPIKSLERKVQQTLRKIKHKFEENDYKKLHSTDSRPGLFYRTPKLHKLQQQQQQKRLKELRMRQIISNMARQLMKLLDI